MGKRGSLAYPGWENTAGSKSRTARLTEQQAIEILRQQHTGQPASVVAGQFGVVPQTVRDIWRGRKWRHIRNLKQEGQQ